MNYQIAVVGAALMLGISSPGHAQAPTELQSSSMLTADAGKRDSWTYRSPTAALTKYKRFLIQPTSVFADPSAQWGSSTPAQRQKYATQLTNALRAEIGKSYQIADRPGPDVAIMHLTLLGVEPTIPLVATASRATPFGLALNGVKSLVGKPGSFTGAVHAAFELTDAASGELLFAAVRHRSPNALDIGATLSTESTVAAVAEEFAQSIRKGVDKANGR